MVISFSDLKSTETGRIGHIHRRESIRRVIYLQCSLLFVSEGNWADDPFLEMTLKYCYFEGHHHRNFPKLVPFALSFFTWIHWQFVDNEQVKGFTSHLFTCHLVHKCTRTLSWNSHDRGARNVTMLVGYRKKYDVYE